MSFDRPKSGRNRAPHIFDEVKQSMRTSIGAVLVFCAGASAAACSDPPAPTVIIVRETPAGGGQTSTSTGGAAPITFMGTSGNVGMTSTGSVPATSPSSSAQPPGSSSGGSTGAAGAPAASGLPCDVATYLAAKCASCHGNPPLPSALAGLVTYADLKATSKEDPTKNEAELSVARMKNAASPMPPGAPPPATDVAILEDWIAAGYPMGSCGNGNGTAADGGSSVPPPPSVFEGAPAFQAQTGPRAHNAGKDCMSCHRTGGGEAPRFSFGGTLYDQSGNPVAGAEVRLVDANGKAASVYTGTNGTFYGEGSGFAAPAQVGVRNASSAKDMVSALQASNGGGCSSCHCTGGTCSVPPIHLP